MDIEIEIQISSVFWSPPPTPPPFELPENAVRIANFHGHTVEELEAMRPDEIRELVREWFECTMRRLYNRILALEAQQERLLDDLEEEEEDEEEPKTKFYSILGFCGSKDPHNRCRKNLHNLMYFYTTFPIMM